jgi:DnaJ-domain-containing protein 1
MRIPWWIWILFGLTAISWIVPDGIPGEEFLLPALAITGLLLRRFMMKNYYQQQYKNYQSSGGASGGTYGAGAGSAGSQSSSSFYNRFRGWGAGFQQPPGPGTAVKDPYSVLGVTKGASMDAIKKAYRDKLKKYHPDVISSLKLGPEYREMFEEKTREIQDAYEKLGGK